MLLDCNHEEGFQNSQTLETPSHNLYGIWTTFDRVTAWWLRNET